MEKNKLFFFGVHKTFILTFFFYYIIIYGPVQNIFLNVRNKYFVFRKNQQNMLKCSDVLVVMDNNLKTFSYILFFLKKIF